MKTQMKTLKPTHNPSTRTLPDGDALSLPKGWREVRLGDVGKLARGKSKHRPRWAWHLFGGKYPFIQTGQIKSAHKYIKTYEQTYSEEGLSQSKLWEKNTLCITIAANIAEIAVLEFPACFPDSVLGFIANDQKCDLDFIYYNFTMVQAKLRQLAIGSVQDNINLGTFESLQFLLPPLPEQKAIAEILSSLDDKIDLLHRQNKTLENMAQALFRKWFIEEADESWEIGVIGDILTVKGGTTPSTRNPEYWNGNIHWTTPKDLSNHCPIFLMDTLRKITKKGLDKIGSGLLPAGTLLLSSRAPVGYMAFSAVPIAINQGYIAIIADKGYSNLFIYSWLKLNMDYVKSFANGSTFQEISKTAFKSLAIVMPREDKRRKFDEIVEPSFEKIYSNQLQINTLENLREILLPKLMSGVVRIKSNG